MVSRFLHAYGTAICFGLALLIALTLSWHTISSNVLPIADGEGYAMRGFALYGYLHTGQWGQFIDLLTRPGQSIFPLHYLPFLLLPRALAGFAAYVILQNLCTFLVMAWAVDLLACMLDRRAWAPAIFLLWAMNNLGLIDFYTFFLDMQFSGVAILALAWQIGAWKSGRGREALCSGLALGALFFVKPANALIFTALYLLAEIIFAWTARRLFSLRVVLLKLAGFLPVVVAAIACGAVQTILWLIDQNEIHENISPLACTGLLRLFYFPLCFAACYHVILLGSLFVVAYLIGRSLRGIDASTERPSFPLHLLVPALLVCVLFGEFFSFWMTVKPVRALLFMLPLLWLGVARLWEWRRLRVELMLGIAVGYAAIVFAQKEFNLTRTHDHLVEDNYQIGASSWTEMPSAWRRGESFNQVICDQITALLPRSGVVCVNLIEVRNALAWRLRNDDLLQGRPPRYEVRNLFNYRGEYYDHALEGANVVALVTMFQLQSNRMGWLQTMGLVGYGSQAWCNDAQPRARQIDLPMLGDESIGTAFIFTPPLATDEVDMANHAAPLATARRVPENSVTDTLRGRFYSNAEAWALLQAWFEKRFD